MDSRAVHASMPILVTLILAFLTHPTIAGPVSTTKMYVAPSSVVDPTLIPGSRFNVDLVVSDVDFEFGCYSWQVRMSWDPKVLELVNITEGDFLKDQPEGTMGVSRIEEDWALFGWTTLGRHPGVRGSGVLATVEFSPVGIGESILDIDHPLTYLLSIPVFDIPCNKDDGYFSNFGAAVVLSKMDVKPDILNLKGKGKWVKAYIELPEDYNLDDIDTSSIKLNAEVEAELHPIEVGDYDADGINDLMVKFDRQDLIATLSEGEVTLKITGEVNGIPFEGSDTIRVIGG